MNSYQYVVKGEHTLGYIFAANPTQMGVISGNKDGHDWRSGVVAAYSTRPATTADFEKFRVKLPPNFKERT